MKQPYFKISSSNGVRYAKSWNTAERVVKSLKRRGIAGEVVWINQQGQSSFVERWQGNPGHRHLTKTQRMQRAKKTTAKTRIAKALRAFLQKQNPGMKLAGAAIQRLKGGVLKITPIKVNRARGKRR
jgi:hypothetical protein